MPSLDRRLLSGANVNVFGVFALALGMSACTVTEVVDDEDNGNETSTSATGSGTGGAGGTTGVGGAGGDGGMEPVGPETSAQSLARQQAAKGWGPDRCPSGTVGDAVGDVLTDLTLYDCDGNPVPMTAFCGADAAWLFFAHGWCPHCRKSADYAETVHDGFPDANLASLNVLVETSSSSAPDANDCKLWREQYAHGDVITLYDPTGEAFKLWEENFTALNVILDDQVIRTKTHTDVQATIEAEISGALTP